MIDSRLSLGFYRLVARLRRDGTRGSGRGHAGCPPVSERASVSGGFVVCLVVLLAAAGPCPGEAPRAEAVAAPPGPESVSVFDVFTSRTVAPVERTEGSAPPADDASREMSPEGAHALLNNARRLLDEQNRERGRKILRDILTRRPMDDPAAQAAALLLAQTAEDPAAAEPYLRLLHLSGANVNLAAQASTTALGWASRADSQTPPGADQPPALALIELAEQHALRAGDPSLLEAAVLARARLYLTLRNPEAAWEALTSAENAGLVKIPGAEWLAFRGDAALATRRTEDAREAYSRLAQGFPGSPETQRRATRLGLLSELAGDTQAARQAYRFHRPAASTPGDPDWVETRLRALQHPYFPPQGNRENLPTR